MQEAISLQVTFKVMEPDTMVTKGRICVCGRE